jgi:hypothetical protein
LWPIIDEVLHERWHPYTAAGSYWIEHSDGDIQLRIHDLAEALCDALCKAVGDLTVERDASRLIINDLTAEVERLRAAGDALAEACAFVRAHPPEVTRSLAAWQEARRG